MRRFDTEREEMVALIVDRGVKDQNVLRAMSAVHRHLFVPEPFTSRAYEDSALPIGKGQTISQPYTVALMTEALQVRSGGKILEIGTGSGYQAAILAEMGAHVFSIERDPDLLAGARQILETLGYHVAAKCGDGTVGWKEFGPFNGIIVTAGAPSVPQPLLDQLANGGRLVIPVGNLEFQTLVICTRHGKEIVRKETDGFKFVPLVGKMGWR